MTLIILLLTAIIGFILIWVHTQPDEPAGATIRRNNLWGWNYTLEDSRGMAGTGYLTRNSAIRAAQQELDRLHEKDQQTQ